MENPFQIDDLEVSENGATHGYPQIIYFNELVPYYQPLLGTPMTQGSPPIAIQAAKGLQFRGVVRGRSRGWQDQ